MGLSSVVREWPRRGCAATSALWPSRQSIERLFSAIETHLGDPEFLAEYVQEFHRATAELRDTSGQRRKKLTAELADIETSIKRVVGLLEEGPSRALRQRLADLELRRDNVEAEKATMASLPVQLLPNAAAAYREKIGDLKSVLEKAKKDDRAEAHAAIRDLIEKIVIKTEGPYRPASLEIHGNLAALFGSDVEPTLVPLSQGALVRGIGFEPMTFRLSA